MGYVSICERGHVSVCGAGHVSVCGAGHVSPIIYIDKPFHISCDRKIKIKHKMAAIRSFFVSFNDVF